MCSNVGDNIMDKCPNCGHRLINKSIDEYLEDLKALFKEATKSKESARKFLISTGAYNERGELTEQYK